MSSSPVLDPPELPGVAALPADPQQALLALVQQLKNGQAEQTQLINKLQKTVLTSRTMINELISAQNDMKSELEKLRGSGGGECEVCANRRDAAVAMAAVTSTGQTTDELIDTLIEGRE
jgi:4-diphosphocytidyl-2C-methyl-D-erythritol kinase